MISTITTTLKIKGGRIIKQTFSPLGHGFVSIPIKSYSNAQTLSVGQKEVLGCLPLNETPTHSAQDILNEVSQ